MPVPNAQSQHATAYPKAALSVVEFCATTSIGRAKFYEEVAEGRIQTLKSGRRTLIPVSEVSRWLNSLPTSKAA